MCLAGRLLAHFRSKAVFCLPVQARVWAFALRLLPSAAARRHQTERSWLVVSALPVSPSIAMSAAARSPARPLSFFFPSTAFIVGWSKWPCCCCLRRCFWAASAIQVHHRHAVSRSLGSGSSAGWTSAARSCPARCHSSRTLHTSCCRIAIAHVHCCRSLRRRLCHTWCSLWAWASATFCAHKVRSFWNFALFGQESISQLEWSLLEGCALFLTERISWFIFDLKLR